MGTLICFGNGWKLIKMNFSSNFFLKVDLIGCFRELHVRKFRKFSPDHFYDLKNRFYDKKTDFRPETRESMTSETTWESRVRRRFRESRVRRSTVVQNGTKWAKRPIASSRTGIRCQLGRNRPQTKTFCTLRRNPY